MLQKNRHAKEVILNGKPLLPIELAVQGKIYVVLSRRERVKRAVISKYLAKEKEKEEEIYLFKKSKTKLVLHLKRLIGEKEKTSPKELDILRSHVYSLDKDPIFTSEIIEEIEKNNYTAAYAIEQVKKKYLNLFTGQNGQASLFKERALDMSDIMDKLQIYVLNVESIDLSKLQHGTIVAVSSLIPSQIVQLDPMNVKAVLCEESIGYTSHAAIIARDLKIPVIVGVRDLFKTANAINQARCLINCLEGKIIINPLEETLAKWEEKLISKTTDDEIDQKSSAVETKDGKKIIIKANLNQIDKIESCKESGANGIGLFRTEFLYYERNEPISEEEQISIYSHLLDKFPDEEVVIRTIDVGGDKPIKFLSLPKESNPFLGYRGIRWCIDRPEILKTQLRSLYRSSIHGKLAIMFPMITVIEELEKVLRIVEEVKNELKKENIQFNSHVKLGIMIETPAAALQASAFAERTDFFSIGSNDLIQYTMAADRTSKYVLNLYQPYNPAIWDLIYSTIKGGHSKGTSVGICGELGSDINALPLLIGTGIDSISIRPELVKTVKKIIRNLSYVDCHRQLNEVLKMSKTNSEVEVFLRKNKEKNEKQ